MSGWNGFFFVIYPYICLSCLVLGLIFRYVATPTEWNARSSELFEQKTLRLGSMVFHYAILLSLLGHVGGLLVPDAIMRGLGISTEAHLEVALIMGQLLAPLVVIGLSLLLWRRMKNPEVYATSNPMDFVVIVFILLNALTGLYQAYIAHFTVFTTIGPWLRSILSLHPDPALMAEVPLFMQVHVVSAFTLFALVPFSRLIHLFSVPVTYVVRPFIVYRRRYGEL